MFEMVGVLFAAVLLFLLGVIAIGFLFGGIAAYQSSSARSDAELDPPQAAVDRSICTLLYAALSLLVAALCARFLPLLASLGVIAALALLFVSVTSVLNGSGTGRRLILTAHGLIVAWGLGLIVWYIIEKQALLAHSHLGY
jgi:hypothetical protein